MSIKVLLTHPLPGSRIHELAAYCDLQTWSGDGLLPASQLVHEAQGCAGLICLLTDRLDAAVLKCLPDLEFVSSVSVGVDHIDVAALTARGIPVGNTPGVLVETTADTAFALLLGAARRIAEADRFVRAGHWQAEQPWSPEFFVGKDVAGATLGIIGLGEIGQAVARRAQGFGMRVLGWNRSTRAVAGVEQCELEQVLSRSDFISVNLARTPETIGLLGADQIASMKPGAVFVNTARGGIVDEVALAAALDSGHLFAAGLDVFEQEPMPPDNPLSTHPRVVLTPHLGSATVATRRRMADLAADNALSALRRQCMPHCVNPEVYAASSG
tara:strand:- start:16562 stop:17545 length:984 start_codon:yes stop_codon:yes gene_type:complete